MLDFNFHDLRHEALRHQFEMWATLDARADKEGWPAARFLTALAEHKLAFTKVISFLWARNPRGTGNRARWNSWKAVRLAMAYPFQQIRLQQAGHPIHGG